MMCSEDFALVKQIGKGGYGTAHIVQHKVTGERFVLKRVRLARLSAKERQASVRELHLLANLRHRNILKYLGCWVEHGCVVCLLVELCESGDLFTQLRLRAPGGVAFNEEMLQEMAVQLLSAIDYLHRSSIVHRDLKSGNILITGDGCLKLADFGLATVLEDGSCGLTNTVVGTPNYMCPEVLQEKPYGIKNDVWGLGCVLYELTALKPAFQAFNMAGLVKKITAAQASPLPANFSDNWRGLVRCMLSKEPAKRPTAAELLEQPWLQPAVSRVRAKFGSELPRGAPDVLGALKDLPDDIMKLLDQFKEQEREDKRRAEESKARQEAAAARWAPKMGRPDANAAQKVAIPPPLKPHQPRLPARAAAAAAAAGGLAKAPKPGYGIAAAGNVPSVPALPPVRRASDSDALHTAKASPRQEKPAATLAVRRSSPNVPPSLPPPLPVRAVPQAAACGAARLPPPRPQSIVQRQDPHGAAEPRPGPGPSGRPSSAPPDSPVRRPPRFSIFTEGRNEALVEEEDSGHGHGHGPRCVDRDAVQGRAAAAPCAASSSVRPAAGCHSGAGEAGPTPTSTTAGRLLGQRCVASSSGNAGDGSGGGATEGCGPTAAEHESGWSTCYGNPANSGGPPLGKAGTHAIIIITTQHDGAEVAAGGGKCWDSSGTSGSNQQAGYGLPRQQGVDEVQAAAGTAPLPCGSSCGPPALGRGGGGGGFVIDDDDDGDDEHTADLPVRASSISIAKLVAEADGRAQDVRCLEA